MALTLLGDDRRNVCQSARFYGSIDDGIDSADAPRILLAVVIGTAIEGRPHPFRQRGWLAKSLP